MDPITLSTVGALALTEGIKFLYGQAGEILKRWRERRDNEAKNPTIQTNKIEPVTVVLPAVFEGQLLSPQLHFEAVARLEDQIRALRKDLFEYADGTEPIDVTNDLLLHKTDALRQALEAVYQQHITFKGEQRPPSGPSVEGSINVDKVAGYAAAVHIRQVNTGTVAGDAEAGVVEAGGQLFGVDIDTLGQ